MDTKIYQARTMAEALAEVKQDLGRDAVILQTRSFRKGGLLGIGGRGMWEVTASAHLNVPQRPADGRYVPVETPIDAPVSQPTPAAAGDPAQMVREVSEIRRMVESLLTMREQACGVGPYDSLEQLEGHLRRQEIAADVAGEILDELRLSVSRRELSDKAMLRRRVLKIIAGRIATVGRSADGDGAQVIALIGPTGVGKTTTIAKLAANCKLRAGKRVGLITIDTYRIAAVDQLRTYAEIIDVPFSVVLSPGELHEAIQSLREMDVVLIDTAGRSQNDALRINQLRSFLSVARADQVHLVLSAAAGAAGTKSILEKFLPLGVNRITLTKLDEAETFGAILNVAVAGQTPLSYVTTGQNVPDDMEAADADRLAKLVLEGKPDAH